MDSFNPVLPAVQPAAPVDSSLTHLHDAPSSSVVAAEVASLDNFTDESGKRQGFLVKLYTMIEEADQDVVAWENGRIVMRNPLVIESALLPKYFRHSHFSSFQRQLNNFGFKKIEGKGKMAPCVYCNRFLGHNPTSAEMLTQVAKRSERDSTFQRVAGNPGEYGSYGMHGFGPHGFGPPHGFMANGPPPPGAPGVHHGLMHQHPHHPHAGAGGGAPGAPGGGPGGNGYYMPMSHPGSQQEAAYYQAWAYDMQRQAILQHQHMLQQQQQQQQLQQQQQQQAVAEQGHVLGPAAASEAAAAGGGGAPTGAAPAAGSGEQLLQAPSLSPPPPVPGFNSSAFHSMAFAPQAPAPPPTEQVVSPDALPAPAPPAAPEQVVEPEQPPAPRVEAPEAPACSEPEAAQKVGSKRARDDGDHHDQQNVLVESPPPPLMPPMQPQPPPEVPPPATGGQNPTPTLPGSAEPAAAATAAPASAFPVAEGAHFAYPPAQAAAAAAHQPPEQHAYQHHHQQQHTPQQQEELYRHHLAYQQHLQLQQMYQQPPAYHQHQQAYFPNQPQVGVNPQAMFPQIPWQMPAVAAQPLQPPALESGLASSTGAEDSPPSETPVDGQSTSKTQVF